MDSITIKNDKTPEVMKAIEEAIPDALEIIGIKIEKYAKALCPVGTPESTGKKGYRGGTLRNSITHEVEEKELAVGSNVEYAPYVELGTGRHFQMPPEWEHFGSEKGAGLVEGMTPRPYLRPAVEDHLNEYVDIFKSEIKKALDKL